MTNNIIINNYGDEDTKYITCDYILKLLKNKTRQNQYLN